MKTIRDLIRPELARLQWGNGDLARVLGVSETRVYKILRQRPSRLMPRTLGNLARALGVGVDIFFPRTPQECPDSPPDSAQGCISPAAACSDTPDASEGNVEGETGERRGGGNRR